MMHSIILIFEAHLKLKIVKTRINESDSYSLQSYLRASVNLQLKIFCTTEASPVQYYSSTNYSAAKHSSIGPK